MTRPYNIVLCVIVLTIYCQICATTSVKQPQVMDQEAAIKIDLRGPITGEHITVLHMNKNATGGDLREQVSIILQLPPEFIKLIDPRTNECVDDGSTLQSGEIHLIKIPAIFGKLAIDTDYANGYAPFALKPNGVLMVGENNFFDPDTDPFQRISLYPLDTKVVVDEIRHDRTDCQTPTFHFEIKFPEIGDECGPTFTLGIGGKPHPDFLKIGLLYYIPGRRMKPGFIENARRIIQSHELQNLANTCTHQEESEVRSDDDQLTRNVISKLYKVFQYNHIASVIGFMAVITGLIDDWFEKYETSSPDKKQALLLNTCAILECKDLLVKQTINRLVEANSTENLKTLGLRSGVISLRELQELGFL